MIFDETLRQTRRLVVFSVAPRALPEVAIIGAIIVTAPISRFRRFQTL